MKAYLKKVWGYLKPPLTLREAKRKGPRYLVLIIVFYLIRDLVLYVILPLTVFKTIFN